MTAKLEFFVTACRVDASGSLATCKDATLTLSTLDGALQPFNSRVRSVLEFLQSRSLHCCLRRLRWVRFAHQRQTEQAKSAKKFSGKPRRKHGRIYTTFFGTNDTKLYY